MRTGYSILFILVCDQPWDRAVAENLVRGFAGYVFHEYQYDHPHWPQTGAKNNSDPCIIRPQLLSLCQSSEFWSLYMCLQGFSDIDPSVLLKSAPSIVQDLYESMKRQDTLNIVSVFRQLHYVVVCP